MEEKMMAISSRTESRKARIELLLSMENMLVKLFLASHKERENVHIKKYKKIHKNLKELFKEVKSDETTEQKF
jgi:hypothetical protein